MKNFYFTLSVFLCFIFSVPVISQSSNDYARKAYGEKIYLQTDNEVYAVNSTLWFKASVVNAATLTGDYSSGVLYVDLISPSNEVVEHKIIKLRKGIGSGHFDIDGNIEAGNYQLRAYTEWNKNFDEDFVFTKPLEVVSPFKKTNSKLAKKDGFTDIRFDKATKNAFDIQFFPEGGKLLNGIESKVGFKGINSAGLGMSFKGSLVDFNGESIHDFTSNDLGMGAFTFSNLNSAKTYKIKITELNGKSIERLLDFPKVYSKGHALKVYADNSNISVDVQGNVDVLQPMTLKTSSRGITYSTNEIGDNTEFKNNTISKIDLPEGIIVFSLLDYEGKIVSERLFFNRNGMSSANLDVKLNKQTFNTRDEVVISMSANAEINSSVEDNYNSSVLVLDKSKIDTEATHRNNILSYLLLTSDLKGFVQSPEVYFNSDAKYDIDALMLTQGWRDYIYDNEKNNVFKYQRELGIPFKGVVRTKKNENRGKLDFAVMEIGKDISLVEAPVQAPGSFYFEVDDLVGDYNKIVMSPLNTDNKESAAIDVVLTKKPKYAPIKSAKAPLVLKEEVTEEVLQQQLQIIDNDSEYFENLRGYNRLDEVVVNGYRMTPKRREMAERYGMPNVVIEGKELRKKITKRSRGLVDVLMSFRDKVFVGNRSKRSFMDPTFLRVGTTQTSKGQEGMVVANAINGQPERLPHINMVVVDGIPVNQFNHILIEDIKTEEVTSFEIIDDPSQLKQLYAEVFNTIPPSGFLSGSILSIYTRNGKGLFGALNITEGQKMFDVQGFAVSKQFYTPKYDVDDSYFDNKPDLRQTIFWEPQAKSKNGESAEVRYFHSDNAGEFMVFIETISENGKIGYKQLEYSVKGSNND